MFPQALVEENLALEERNRELRIVEVRLMKKSGQFDEVKESLNSDILRLKKDAAALEDALGMYKEENRSLKSSMATGWKFDAPVAQGQIETLLIYPSFIVSYVALVSFENGFSEHHQE